MAHEERGIATAMSLGGKARDIAQSIPQIVLGRRDGLVILLRAIEAEMGPEPQDRIREAGKAFRQFRRGKNMSSSEYVSVFEHCMQMQSLMDLPCHGSSCLNS